MIKLVPIITTDSEGNIVPAAKTRRIEKSLTRICELVERDIEGKDVEAMDFFVTFTGTSANGEMLRDMVMERFPVRICHFMQGHYSILRYLGPEAAGLSYYIHP
jgi:fatty acid-binding protein DegV